MENVRTEDYCLHLPHKRIALDFMEAIVCRFDMFDWSLNMGGKPRPRAGSQREKTLAEARHYSLAQINVNDYFLEVLSCSCFARP